MVIITQNQKIGAATTVPICEGLTIESVTSQFGLSQIINEVSHILESSCALILFPQRSLIW